MMIPCGMLQSGQFLYEREVLGLVPCPHHSRPNVTEGTDGHDELCHRFIIGRLIKMDKIIGTEGHPDSLALNSKSFCCLARFLLPVRNLLDAFAPLIREVH